MARPAKMCVRPAGGSVRVLWRSPASRIGSDGVLTTAAIMAAVVSARIFPAPYFPTAFHRSALVCGAAEVCTLM